MDLGSTLRLALDLLERSDIRGIPTDTQLDLCLAAFGVRCEEVSDAPPCLREVLLGKRLIINANLSENWRRWLKGHALGHLVCRHHGNHFKMAPLAIRRQEDESNIFAGCFLSGALVLLMVLSAPVLATYAMIPPECAELWLSLTREVPSIAASRPE